MTRRRSPPTGPGDPPAAAHLQRGQRAEALARAHLEAAGLVPVAQNFRCRFGELDLVMRDGPCLVMVEVRYLARPIRTTPAGTIDAGKRRRLVLAARSFLGRWPGGPATPVRFDVVGISGSGAGLLVDWIRHAFTLDDVAGG